MLDVAEELDRILKSSDPATAERLEGKVWELLENMARPVATVRGKGRPPGYFERIPGALKGEEFERPEQLPFEIRETWE